MRFLDLFAGIGGFSLGLERVGMTCVGHVEIDPFGQKVLKEHWPEVPLIADVKEVQGDEFGAVELICGGPPCQPVSLAGKRQGQGDDRWLWGEALRLVEFVRPLGAFSRILLESSRWASTEYWLTWKVSATPQGRLRFRLVPSAPRTSGNGSGSWRTPLGTDGKKSGHGNLPYQAKATWPTPVANDENQDRRTMASTAREWNREGGSRSSLPLVVKMLATWPTPRAEKHTPQQREDFTPKLPMVAMWTTPQSHDSQGRANPDRLLRHGNETRLPKSQRRSGVNNGWTDYEWIECTDGKARRVKPGVLLLAHGVPGRVARLRALGNAVVPEVVERIGRAMMETEQQSKDETFLRR